MKKIIMLFITIFILAGCNIGRKEYISKIIELNLKDCSIKYEKDTHGGFLGDGDYFARIGCPSARNFSSNWKSLPLSTAIEDVMNIKQCDNECKTVFEKYNIPEVKNGFYYFLDRHSDSKDKYSDTEINNRLSYNFSIAIYNSDNNILYYYELDT